MGIEYDKKLFRECELKAEKQRILRHIPFMEKYSRAHKYGENVILSTEEGRKKLVELVKGNEPFMAGRFGTSEGRATVECFKSILFGKSINPVSMDEICIYSGFFPRNEELLIKFAKQEAESCKNVDILGVMNFYCEEWLVRTFCPDAILMPNGGLASASRGWAHCLEGMKVLVVHPFAKTIESQYRNNREEIFPGTNALPLFDLKTFKAVQTIADETDDRFKDWFEALDYMTDEISKFDFEIALIGCGAYGFQLSSRIKNMGKKAVHMGGSVQTLFGIKGSRWDVKYSDIYNDSWVYPSDEETPKGYEKVEGGCYWK